MLAPVFGKSQDVSLISDGRKDVGPEVRIHVAGEVPEFPPEFDPALARKVEVQQDESPPVQAERGFEGQDVAD